MGYPVYSRTHSADRQKKVCWIELDTPRTFQNHGTHNVPNQGCHWESPLRVISLWNDCIIKNADSSLETLDYIYPQKWSTRSIIEEGCSISYTACLSPIQVKEQSGCKAMNFVSCIVYRNRLAGKNLGALSWPYYREWFLQEKHGSKLMVEAINS